GVSDEALEKLFDVFYRTDPSRSNPSKGSGLGLSITAKILEQLGGSIKAENVTEGGLAIIMTLPKYTGNKNN
ncbi:ATP-binding protein, partial [Clostridium sp.]|uniref:ATP-binding protein n=1 Tax=Clostridium sp. TaxID=1506 RepID=UPI0028513409